MEDGECAWSLTKRSGEIIGARDAAGVDLRHAGMALSALSAIGAIGAICQTPIGAGGRGKCKGKIKSPPG
ncbi:MAG: hypothetical protein ACTHKB_05080 [Burkholderiaceae bacterium]